MQEVKLLSEGQETPKRMVEDKIRLQSRAMEQTYEEMKKLELKKSEEALLFVQKRHDSWRYQNERDEAGRLQRSGSSRRMEKEVDSQDLLSFQSCRSSAVERQDVQEVMGEIAGNATRGRGEDAWRLEQEGDTETPETRVVTDGVEGVHVDLNGECHHARGQEKSRSQSDAPGEEGGEIKSSMR